MHAAELVDLAAILALHGPSLLYRRELIPQEAMQAYWLANRTRFDAWHQAISDYQHLADTHAIDAMQAWWKTSASIVEEVLLSEPLTRVYAALGSGLDNERAAEEISPVTHSVYLTHLEARARILRLMLDSRLASLDHAVRLNKLRSTTERWCDALLGHLASQQPNSVHRYAFDPPRAAAFAEDTQQIPAGMARETAGWLTSAAMRDALMRRSNPSPAFPDANRAVADAVLMSLRPDMFDSVGRCKSLWLHRLERGAEQTDRVLHSLAQADITNAGILGGYEAIRAGSFGRW